MGVIRSEVKNSQVQSRDVKSAKGDRLAHISQSLQELHRLSDDRELKMLRFLLSMALEETGAVSATLKEQGRT